MKFFKAFLTKLSPLFFHELSHLFSTSNTSESPRQKLSTTTVINFHLSTSFFALLSPHFYVLISSCNEVIKIPTKLMSRMKNFVQFANLSRVINSDTNNDENNLRKKAKFIFMTPSEEFTAFRVFYDNWAKFCGIIKCWWKVVKFLCDY